MIARDEYLKHLIAFKDMPVVNPNRSLDRLFNQSRLFQVCLCHISISLCSMTLLGLGIASKLPLLSLYATFASDAANLLETNTNLA